MNRKLKYLAICLVGISLLLPAIGSVLAKRPDEWKGVGRSGSGLFIYVESQELYFDSIVAADPLPWNEHIDHTFQQLFGAGYGAPHYTEYGPGDPEYRGGRWWVDTNPNGYQDAYDTFFSCPLLGPGYSQLPV